MHVSLTTPYDVVALRDDDTGSAVAAAATLTAIAMVGEPFSPTNTQD